MCTPSCSLLCWTTDERVEIYKVSGWSSSSQQLTRSRRRSYRSKPRPLRRLITDIHRFYTSENAAHRTRVLEEVICVLAMKKTQFYPYLFWDNQPTSSFALFCHSLVLSYSPPTIFIFISTPIPQWNLSSKDRISLIDCRLFDTLLPMIALFHLVITPYKNINKTISIPYRMSNTNITLKITAKS